MATLSLSDEQQEKKTLEISTWFSDFFSPQDVEILQKSKYYKTMRRHSNTDLSESPW